MERHNFEVSHVGFRAYTQATREGRFRRKRPRERFQYKQHVFVFSASFNAGYKPNARSHNITQEDIDHFLKWGSFLHGEWFEGGARCPGGPAGEARPPLPSMLEEAPMAPAPFPEYDRRLEVSDGCGSQYDSGTQHHQTAEWKAKTAGWPEAKQAAEAAAAELAAAQAAQASAEEAGREEEAAAAAARAAAAAARKAVAQGGIVRVHVKKVEHHGKAGVTDGMGNLPTFAIKAAIESKTLVNPGTRDLVLFLADHFRRGPAVAKEQKDGWLAATKYFFGFFDTAKFTKRAVPECEAKGWHCSEQHVYTGLCADAQKAERDGPLRTGRMFCACLRCTLLDFDNCERTAQVGRMRHVTVPPPRGAASRVAQVESLVEWAALLKPGWVVGVRVASDQVHLEGKAWLLLVDSEAFEAPEGMVHSSDSIEDGWLVVRGRWYECMQRSPRGYKLLKESRLILVNTMIRLPGICFNGGAPGKYPRGSSEKETPRVRGGGGSTFYTRTCTIS